MKRTISQIEFDTLVSAEVAKRVKQGYVFETKETVELNRFNTLSSITLENKGNGRVVRIAIGKYEDSALRFYTKIDSDEEILSLTVTSKRCNGNPNVYEDPVLEESISIGRLRGEGNRVYYALGLETIKEIKAKQIERLGNKYVPSHKRVQFNPTEDFVKKISKVKGFTNAKSESVIVKRHRDSHYSVRNTINSNSCLYYYFNEKERMEALSC